jgi:ATP phosphoribosyltransferase
VQVELIYLGGSVELAPLVGLSDYVVDLVQTGRTLRENGLVEVEEIMRSTARLVVNRASQKTKYEPIMQLIHQMKAYLSS